MSDLEDKIKKALDNDIQVTNEDKEEIWNKIEKDLFTGENKGEIKVKKQNKKPFIGFIATAAAVAILFLGTQTDIGHALIDQIKELFEPEKQITQDIEGNKEKTDVNLHQSRESDYVIYVDEERYRFIDGEESDRIVPKTPLDEKYPEVSMEVMQISNMSPEDVIKDIEADIEKDHEIFHQAEAIDEPIVGWTTRGLTGSEWNSKVTKVYVFSNGNQGSFIITQRYYLEAAEGHGARFDQMVKEFHLVDEVIEKQ